MKLHDGTILNSNLKLDKVKKHNRYENFGLQKAMILDKFPKDHKNNKFKMGMEYRAVITGGPREGELLSGVMPLDGIGGKDNFSETVYTAKSEVIKGKNKGDSTPPENTDGSYVIVGFLAGHYNNPIILGAWPQPNNTQYGATEEDGVLTRGQFNDMKWKLDKDGIFTLERQGTTITFDSETNGIKIDSDKDINLNSSSNIFLGDGATEKVILGDAFKAFFNAHVHDGPPPATPMDDSLLSSIVKVIE